MNPQYPNLWKYPLISPIFFYMPTPETLLFINTDTHTNTNENLTFELLKVCRQANPAWIELRVMYVGSTVTDRHAKLLYLKNRIIFFFFISLFRFVFYFFPSIFFILVYFVLLSLVSFPFCWFRFVSFSLISFRFCWFLFVSISFRTL